MAQENSNHDHLLKILLIGDSGVGKSSILIRFVDNEFDEKQLSTIGCDFKIKMVPIGGKNLKLTLWDTAGQERFRTLTCSYYRGSHAAVFVYDVTRRSSLFSVKKWLQEFRINGSEPSAITMLVANKIDMQPQEVTKEEGAALAQEYSMLFVQTSAKTNDGIQHAFEELCHKILESPTLLAKTRTDKAGAGGLFTLESEQSEYTGASGCC